MSNYIENLNNGFNKIGDELKNKIIEEYSEEDWQKCMSEYDKLEEEFLEWIDYEHLNEDEKTDANIKMDEFSHRFINKIIEESEDRFGSKEKIYPILCSKDGILYETFHWRNIYKSQK